MHYDIDFRQARVTDGISWAAIDIWLWPYNVPFVKGGPRAQVSKEVWGPQKQESQESAGQKQSMALVQKHTAISNTPAQNVRDSIREPTVSTVAVVGLTPKPQKFLGIQNPKRPINLDQEARRDLSAWLLFIKHFNGTAMFLHDRWILSSKLHFHTESAGSIGYAAVFGNHWFNGAWDQSWIQLDISIKEMFPVVIALETWGHLIKNHCICFHIDNMAVVHILNKQSARDPLMIVLVRRFVLAAMKFNILFKAVHIPTHLSISCDALSRFKMERFRQASPQADIAPWPLPKDVLKIT